MVVMEVFLFCFLPALCSLISLIRREYLRTRKRGADSFSIFSLLFAAECLVPLAVISAFFSFREKTSLKLGNELLDLVYFSFSSEDLIIVAVFAILFYFITYIFYACVTGGLEAREIRSMFRVTFNKLIMGIILVTGAVSLIIMLSQGADSIAESYRWLVRFRNLDPNIERNFLNANMFSLIQPLLFLSTAGLLICKDKTKARYEIFLWLAATLFFGVAAVSRKAIFIPLFLIISTELLAKKKVKFAQIFSISLIVVVVLLLVKPLFTYVIGARGDVKTSASNYDDAILYLASDAGLTVCESLGVISLVHMPMRLGIDHLLSIARRLPEESLGLPDLLPQRIVRRTTEIFYHADAQDIPPGLMGMMWLDYRWFGPIIYGGFFGIGLGMIERLRKKFVSSHAASAMFSIALFVFCLPINTGSLDFTFSMDVFFLFLLLALTIKIKKQSILSS